jgi:hypothetical protein
MRGMLRTFLLRSLLAFTLLFTQQGLVTHAIAHTLAEQAQDHSLPHDQQCELCAAYAQLGSAVGSAEIHFDLTASFGEAHTVFAATPHPSAFAAFAARAPPRSA